jgi:hypothetical protein
VTIVRYPRLYDYNTKKPCCRSSSRGRAHLRTALRPPRQRSKARRIPTNADADSYSWPETETNCDADSYSHLSFAR